MRPASSGENSTSGHSDAASPTDALICLSTSSRVLRSLYFRWMSEVARKVWMRGRSAPLRASQARLISSSLARASAAMTGRRISAEIALTASKSPCDAMGKPPSMMSTARRSSWRAISSFSSRFMLQPGDCSPSRKVVSKMKIFSAIVSPSEPPPPWVLRLLQGQEQQA